MKFKRNRKRCGEENEKVSSVSLRNYQRASCSANSIQQQSVVTLNPESSVMSSQITVYTSDTHFCPKL